MNKKIRSILFLALALLMVLATSCSKNANSLSGEWELTGWDLFNSFENVRERINEGGERYSYTNVNLPDGHYHNSFSFSGKKFIQTDYSSLSRYVSESTDSYYNRQYEERLSEINNPTLIGSYERIDNMYPVDFFCMEYWKGTRKGTYSISDDKIELVYEDGTIDVYSFSRTENTITIEETRYDKKK